VVGQIRGNKEKKERKTGMIEVEQIPLNYLLNFYDIELMEEFEITNMADSPYHFNNCGSLCNCNNEIRDEILSTLLTEPKWFKRSRKMWASMKKD
jgi:hypothetical protein